MNSRLLLRNFVRGGPCARPLLMPLAFHHAHRIDGAPFEDLLGDPARLTRALLDQHRLLGTDALAVHFGLPSIAAPFLEDVTRRLSHELRRETPVLAVLPGPARLAASGSGETSEDCIQRLREIVEGACKSGAEAILIDEDQTGWDEEVIRRHLAPLLNTARYYNAAGFVAAPTPPRERLGDGVLLPETMDAGIAADRRVGLRVPASCFADDEASTRFAAAVAARRHAVFLSAGDDVLTSFPLERIVDVFGMLRGVAYTHSPKSAQD